MGRCNIYRYQRFFISVRGLSSMAPTPPLLKSRAFGPSIGWQWRARWGPSAKTAFCTHVRTLLAVSRHPLAQKTVRHVFNSLYFGVRGAIGRKQTSTSLTKGCIGCTGWVFSHHSRTALCSTLPYPIHMHVVIGGTARRCSVGVGVQPAERTTRTPDGALCARSQAVRTAVFFPRCLVRVYSRSPIGPLHTKRCCNSSLPCAVCFPTSTGGTSVGPAAAERASTTTPYK